MNEEDEDEVGLMLVKEEKGGDSSMSINYIWLDDVAYRLLTLNSMRLFVLRILQTSGRARTLESSFFMFLVLFSFLRGGERNGRLFSFYAPLPQLHWRPLAL